MSDANKPLPQLRIASELHAAPGWTPIVAEGSTAAYQRDVLLWVTPQLGAEDFARRLVETLNRVSCEVQL